MLSSWEAKCVFWVKCSLMQSVRQPPRYYFKGLGFNERKKKSKLKRLKEWTFEDFWNSWSPHFMITLWNQKILNVGTSCILYFEEESSVGCGQDLFREQGFCHQTIKSFQTCETFQESRKTLRGCVSSSSVISSLLLSCKVSKISGL